MLPLSHWQQGYKRLKPHLNLVLVAELIGYLACKLGTVVMNNPPGDTKSMDDMVFNEVNHVENFDFNK